MVDDEKRYSRQLLGRTVVSKTGKRFGEIADLEFESRTGEIINIHLRNPTGYCEGLELEKDPKSSCLLIPFSSVIAIGDFVVVAEEDII